MNIPGNKNGLVISPLCHKCSRTCSHGGFVMTAAKAEDLKGRPLLNCNSSLDIAKPLSHVRKNMIEEYLERRKIFKAKVAKYAEEVNSL